MYVAIAVHHTRTVKLDIYIINRIPVIRYLPLRVTLIFSNKKHALNALKMDRLLRSDVMLS
jgi:hypothetical protein